MVEKSEAYEDFIVYLDDDDRKVESWVIITDITTTSVFFRDRSNNTIMIPIHRILKIKRKRGREENGNN